MQRAFANAARAVRLFRYRHLFTHGVTACLFLACALAHAQVTPLNWYRLGEFDGTAVGQPATAGTDTVGAKPLTMTGSPLVASDVGASAASAVGSTRSLQFPGGNGDYAYYQQPTKVTDNFGMEVWVKPLAASANDQVIVYNGRFGTDGFGIVLKSDGKYYGQFGLPTFGGVTAALNTWVHLAIVRDNGSATLFVNGVAAANSTGLAPTAPPTNGGFTIGNGGPSFVTGLQGLVDEVRLFTLSPGNFDPNMLLFSAKLVTSTANNGAGTLRSQLNAAPKAGTVVISATGTIAIDGPLAIVNRGVYLYGPGAANLILSGTSPNPTRVFFIDTADTVGISDLTIANGVATGGAGGNGSWAGGGGMGAGGGVFANAGNVVLTRVNFAGNSATGGKGGNTNGSACGCMGGGGGLGGAGGSSTALGSAGGGGGWLGAGGGAAAPNYSGGGGGGGVTGVGGKAGASAGGGGGAYNAGTDASNITGGAGADGLGGFGGTFDSSPPYNGGNGLDFGGGGGAAENGNGGNGGNYAGGGGASVGIGGAGGDFGGSGGGTIGFPLSGGFGGGSGGQSQEYAGNGGFGGGSGGSDSSGGGTPGAFGGHGGVMASGAAGGGGAGLGGAIFVRADHGATLTWNDGSADAGTVTGGAFGTGCAGCAFAGSAAGGALFLLGGTTTLNVNSGSQTITGTIAGWVNAPPNITKTGAGTLILAGGGSDLGVITLSKGDLRIKPNVLSLVNGKELDVNTGATLSGFIGSVNGAVKLNAGGTLSPGDPTDAAGVGTFGVGDLTWNGGGKIAHQLAATNDLASDLLNVSGNLTKGSAGSFSFQLADGSSTPVCGTTYTLIHYTGTTTFTAADFAFTYGGAAAIAPGSTFSIDAANHKLQFTPHCVNDQTITSFVAIPANPAYSAGGTFGVTATPAASTAALTFGSSTPAVCSLSGATVTMNTRGVCTLTADQAGDSFYNPAPTVFLTLHFEQLAVNASTPSAFGTIDPPSQVVDYNATATFTVTPQAGYTAVVSGDTCTVTHSTGTTWTSGAITSPCNVTADFIERIFADGFDR